MEYVFNHTSFISFLDLTLKAIFFIFTTTISIVFAEIIEWIMEKKLHSFDRRTKWLD